MYARMEIILLLICSVILARYLERKMKVASIAYSVLFTVSFAYYLFGSDIKFFAIAARNMVGADYYELIHEVLNGGVLIANLSLSSIIIINAVIYLIVGIVSVALFIKGLKKLVSKAKFNKKFVFDFVDHPMDLSPVEGVQIQNFSNIYLLLCQFRN